MNSTPSLTGSYRRTYKTIFQHPISHNLEWRSVYSLLEKIGDVAEEPNGNLKATRNGHTLVLNPPRSKDVAEEHEVMALRHFIEESEGTFPDPNNDESHWLVVIDHHEARIFRSKMHGSIPQQILPHEPDEYFRQAPDSKDFTRGQEKPDPNSFFEPIARALQTAGKILVFGTGTGMSSEMDQFMTWVKLNHPEVAARIVGGVTVNENHLTEDQLLAQAREFYASPHRVPL